jgi:hypothetical protein
LAIPPSTRSSRRPTTDDRRPTTDDRRPTRCDVRGRDRYGMRARIHANSEELPRHRCWVATTRPGCGHTRLTVDLGPAIPRSRLKTLIAAVHLTFS